jgi:hypothetical protein
VLQGLFYVILESSIDREGLIHIYSIDMGLIHIHTYTHTHIHTYTHNTHTHTYTYLKELRTLLTIDVAASTTPCAESISMLANESITLPVDKLGPMPYTTYDMT